MLKNNKMASKRDVCDGKKPEVKVWYLLKTVCDMLCLTDFLIKKDVKIV